jgi:hypothetical protein
MGADIGPNWTRKDNAGSPPQCTGSNMEMLAPVSKLVASRWYTDVALVLLII